MRKNNSLLGTVLFLRNVVALKWKGTVDRQICSISMFYEKIWTSFSTTICIWFLTKIFLMSYFIKWPNYTVCLTLSLEALGNICIVIICCPVCGIINFEINRSIFFRAVFLHYQNVRTKMHICQTFKTKEKVFSILFKWIRSIKIKIKWNK